MPDILKQQGAVPVKKSVRIPDIIFEQPKKISEPVLEEVAGDSQNEREEQETEPSISGIEEDKLPTKYSREPVRLSKEELKELYQTELDEICHEVAQTAYADALKQKKSEIEQAIQAVENQLAEMQEMQQQYMKRYAQEVKYMAVDIAEKMIMTKIDENDMVLNHLVKQVVGGVQNASWLNVEVSEQLVSLVEYLRQEFQKPEYYGKASVTPTVCAKDTCRVTTPDGTIVATISAQAQNLRNAFEVDEKEIKN